MTTVLINVLIDTQINQNADTDLMWVHQTESTYLKGAEQVT